MKAPQPETLDEAIQLASFIRRAENKADTTMWNAAFAKNAWDANTFQYMVDYDWEYLWSEDQCQQIMAQWVAHRISR